MEDLEKLKLALHTGLLATSSIPLHLYGELSTTSNKWRKVLEWKGRPGRRFLIMGYDFATDWPGATGTCSIQVKSNGEEIVTRGNAIDSTPSLYWFSMGQLQFEEVNPAGHLVFLAKSDGTNALEAIVEVFGIQIPIKK